MCGVFFSIFRPICSPKNQQRVLHDGRKRFHSLKFQSVTTPSGMIANLRGPVAENTLISNRGTSINQ